MAKSFSDTIQDASGSTAQVDDQENQAQAAAAGVMTPVGAAGGGLNSDQAKMFGTPAQKSSTLTDAVRYGIQEDMDLATAERRSSSQREVERRPGDQDDVTDWAALADISTNVQQQTEALIAQQIEEASRTINQEAVTTALGNYEVARNFVPADSEYAARDEEYQTAQENYNNALERFKKGEVGYRYMSQMAGKLNYASQQRSQAYQADGAYRKGLFDSVWESLVNGQEPDAVKMDAVVQMLGLEPPNDTPTKIREALGVDIDEIEFSKEVTAADLGDDALLQQIADTTGKSLAEVQSMSVYELQNAVEGVQAEEFNTSEELVRAINDPALGANEKALYAQALEDYGMVSGEKAEQEFESLMEAVDESDTIEFMGKDLSVEDIFNDSKHTTTIAKFLKDEPPGFQEELRNTEGAEEFVALLDKHSEVLTQMVANIDTSMQAGAELAEAGNDARMFNDGTEQIPDNIFETWLGEVPDWDDIQDQSWIQEMENSSLYQAYRNPDKFKTSAGLSDQEYADFLSQIGPLHKIDPTMLKYLAGLPPEELGPYLLEGEGGLSQLDRAISARLEADDLGDLPLDTDDQKAAFFRSLGGDAATLQSMLDSFNGAKRMGIHPDENTADFLALLDQNKDGILDDPSKIQQQIAARGDTSFRQVLEGGKDAFGIDMTTAMDPLKDIDQSLLDTLKDGKITHTEIGTLGTTMEELIAAKEKYGDMLTPHAANTLEQRLNYLSSKQVAEQVNALGIAGLGNFTIKAAEDLNKMATDIDNYTAEYGETSWFGYSDPAKYQEFRQHISKFENLSEADLTVGENLTQKTSDYLRKMRDLARADREKFTKNFRAVRDRKNIWKLLNTAYKPPTLVSIAPGHEIAELQNKILSGEQKIWYADPPGAPPYRPKLPINDIVRDE